MDVRYATGPEHIGGMQTEDLRRTFLVERLFAADEVTAVYSHHDRIVLAGVLPLSGPLTMPTFPEIAAEAFFDRREAGIANVGGPGRIRVDGVVHELGRGACLYVGRGAGAVVFESSAPAQEAGPARYYLFSAPAHTTFPTVLSEAGGGTVRELGDARTSNRRTLRQYIHEGGVQSCQVVMGMTSLETGSMWNTMPAHTHDRRTECYLYFDLAEDSRVVHLMGHSSETRHLIVADEQAVISPSWSVHSGFGSASYSFVWAMAGENRSFDDMDAVPITGMR